MCDVCLGVIMYYCYVDMGKVCQYDYQVVLQIENVEVGDLFYNVLWVYWINGGNNEIIFWIVNGVFILVCIL